MALGLNRESRRHRLGMLVAALFLAFVADVLLFAFDSDGATACGCESVSIQVHKYLPKNNPNNPWENQGASAGEWKFTVYVDNDGQPGEVLVEDLDDLTPSLGFPQQDILVKETGTDGDVFFGWFKPDGDGENSGNDKCGKAPVAFTTGGKYSREEYLAIPASAFDTPGNKTGLLHICAYNEPAPTTRTLRVVKVTDAASHPAAEFGGSLQRFGGASETWTVTLPANAGASTVLTKTISTDEYQLIESVLPPGWTVAGYHVVADPAGTGTCSAPYSGLAGGIPSGASNYLVCVMNTYAPAMREVQVCKVAEANSDGFALPAFEYGFDIRPAGMLAISGANAAAEPNPDTAGSQSAEVCSTKQVPADAPFDVVEWGSRPDGWAGDASGYPKYTLNGAAPVSNTTTTQIPAGTAGVKVAFFNKELQRTKEVVIVKRFTNLNGYLPGAADYPAFTFVPAIDPAPACTIDSGGLPENVTWRCRVPYGWVGTVSEETVPGWQPSGSCAQAVSAIPGPQVVEFCNEPYGNIQIVKTDLTTASNLDRPGDGDWDFAVTGPGGFAQSRSLPFGGGTATIDRVPLGAGYAAAETDGRYGQCSSVSNPDGQGYQTTNVEDGPAALSAPGATITFVFRNEDCGVVLGTGDLDIWKVRDIIGDGAKNGADTTVAWNVTVTGPDFPRGQDFAVPASGLHLHGITEGLYTVSEATRTGWKVVGASTSDGPGLVVSATVQVRVSSRGESTATFFNQPTGAIPVHKDALRSHNGGQATPAPDDDDGWTITVSSQACGVTQQAKTDNHGDAFFADLPLCTDYVVSEAEVNVDSPGFGPLTATRYTNITPNGVTLTFANILRTDEPTTPVVPAVTPEPATPTPVPPTVTPTSTPTRPPTGIAGERTPGPREPTPVAPGTGGGPWGGGAHPAALIGAAILMAIALGLAGIVVGARRR